MEGSVDLGYPAMHRPGVEPAICRSQVQRPSHYTTEQLEKVAVVDTKERKIRGIFASITE